MASMVGSRFPPECQHCDEVTPVNAEDGAETLLVKTLKEMDVTVVGDPGLHHINVK